MSVKDNIKQVHRYYKYLLHSNSRFKIHSPFVFQFVEEVLKDKVVYPEYKQIETYKKNLSKSHTIIETVDFGKKTGDKQYSTYLYPLGKLVKKRSQTKRKGRLLYKISHYFKPANILEFGTAVGISSCYIKTPLPDSKMITMEGCASLSDIAYSTFKKLNLSNIKISTGDFEATLPKVLKDFETLDMVFFDGNHHKKPTIDYFNRCVKLANDKSVFIFDDIHWSKGMEEAWEYIINDKRVTISIDLFHLGLVFFRKGTVKQDFIIRY